MLVSVCNLLNTEKAYQILYYTAGHFLLYIHIRRYHLHNELEHGMVENYKGKVHLKSSVLNAMILCFVVFFFSPRGREIRSDMHYSSLAEFEKWTLTQQYTVLHNRG